MHSRLLVYVLFAAVLAMSISEFTTGFQAPSSFSKQSYSSSRCAASRRDRSEELEEGHFLLKQYATATGEIVNPYQILKVPRDAEKRVIRDAYRKLSKQYHPDRVRFREILPGKCNNFDDVRDEWERIQTSYEILSDEKTRKRYDRHEFVADPGAAIRRAAVGAAATGVSSIGKGLFSMGASAFERIAKK